MTMVDFTSRPLMPIASAWHSRAASTIADSGCLIPKLITL